MTNSTLETLAVYLADLEVRQEGGRPEIRGNFRYDGVATIANTGRRRKERFAPGAFSLLDRAARLSRLTFCRAMNSARI